jgi:3-oxoadipate enol-lactonase
MTLPRNGEVAMKLGFDESGSGPVLLLVHGFPLDRTVWADQLRELSPSRRVVAVDLPGRGKSPTGASSGWTVEDLADDLAETIEDLGVDQVDLTGLSMGGYVAFAFWRRHRELVRSLLLFDTKAEDDGEEAKEGREKTAALAREEGTGALYAGLESKLLAPDAPAEVKERMRRIFESIPGESSAADALAMKNRPDSTGDLASIDVPTLVIRGEQDALMPLELVEKMASQIPDAKLVGIPGAGHLPPIENPKAVTKAVHDFLDGIQK